MRVSTQPITVFVADSQPVFRYGLLRLLEAEAGLSVVGSAATEVELKRGLKQFEPNVLFLDPDIGAAWLDLLREVSQPHPHLHVVVTGSNLPDAETMNALESGARGILARDAPVELFGKCARAVAAGQYWLGRQSVAGLVASLRKARAQVDQKANSELALTSRQLDVLRAVAKGQTNRKIASELGISEDTVKQHVTTIFEKCNVASRVELALFAVNNRLID